MLFFRSCIQSKSLTRHSNPRYLKKICAPLQVQICKIQIYLKKKESGKRALSWVSFKGSLTLEAALCFPLMVFFCVTLLMPMVLMDRQRQIQAVAEAVGEEISRYAYAAYLYENEKKEEIDVSRSEEGADSVPSAISGIVSESSVRRFLSCGKRKDTGKMGTGSGFLRNTDNRR